MSGYAENGRTSKENMTHKEGGERGPDLYTNMPKEGCGGFGNTLNPLNIHVRSMNKQFNQTSSLNVHYQLSCTEIGTSAGMGMEKRKLLEM